MERAEHSGEPAIKLAQTTLLVLCGPSGAGKSTFARKLVQSHHNRYYKYSMIVSSDYCRALVCDDETSQHVNRDAFDLFHYIIHKRMFQGRFTVADSTALQAEARYRLLTLALRHHYHTCLIVFNISPEQCFQHDQARNRTVGEQVITYQVDLLQQALLDIPNESWEQVHILGEQDISRAIEVVVHEQ